VRPRRALSHRCPACFALIDGCMVLVWSCGYACVQYCEGWLFVCERPSVRFLKSWVVLKEAGLHLSDGSSSRVP
jgi:hypothetical protein